jgi:hypothetical protein
MKTKKFLLLTVFVAGGMLCSCSKESPPENTVELPEIKLTAPENGIAFNLQGKQGITFQWEKAKGLSVYKLALSLSEDMSNPKTIKITGNSNSLDAYQLDLDARITALGIEGFTENARIYWTIRPSNDAVNARSEVRYFIAYRLPVIMPGRPSGGEYVDANKFADHKYPFSWTKIENTNAYTLKISSSRDFFENDILYTAETGDTDHFDLSSDDADNIFADRGLQPDQLNSIPFYWTVLPNPAPEFYTAVVDSFYAIRKGVGVAELVKTDWTVTVSTVFDNGLGEYMLDGNPTTSWYANGPATAWNSQAEIDMQTVKMITSIRIDCDYRIKNADFFAVKDKANGWGSSIAILRKASNTGRFDWDIELETPITARYLYLTLNDSYWYGYHIIYDIYVKGYSE